LVINEAAFEEFSYFLTIFFALLLPLKMHSPKICLPNQTILTLAPEDQETNTVKAQEEAETQREVYTDQIEDRRQDLILPTSNII
jgi:hypothetical protein